MGTIDAIENTRKYGFTYEVITITEGVEKVTPMSLWVNLGFMVFLSVIIYLLSIPLPSYFSEFKKKEDTKNGRSDHVSH